MLNIEYFYLTFLSDPQNQFTQRNRQTFTSVTWFTSYIRSLFNSKHLDENRQSTASCQFSL